MWHITLITIIAQSIIAWWLYYIIHRRLCQNGLTSSAQLIQAKPHSSAFSKINNFPKGGSPASSRIILGIGLGWGRRSWLWTFVTTQVNRNLEDWYGLLLVIAKLSSLFMTCQVIGHSRRPRSGWNSWETTIPVTAWWSLPWGIRGTCRDR